MEAQETLTVRGQLTVGTDGQDQPSAVTIRIETQVGDRPVRALASFSRLELVNGLIGQLIRMRDEIWDPKSTPTPAAQGSVDVVTQSAKPPASRYGISVSGRIVHELSDKDRAAAVATRLRQRLAAGETIGSALIAALQAS